MSFVSRLYGETTWDHCDQLAVGTQYLTGSTTTHWHVTCGGNIYHLPATGGVVLTPMLVIAAWFMMHYFEGYHVLIK